MNSSLEMRLGRSCVAGNGTALGSSEGNRHCRSQTSCLHLPQLRHRSNKTPPLFFTGKLLRLGSFFNLTRTAETCSSLRKPVLQPSQPPSPINGEGDSLIARVGEEQPGLINHIYSRTTRPRPDATGDFAAPHHLLPCPQLCGGPGGPHLGWKPKG